MEIKWRRYCLSTNKKVNIEWLPLVNLVEINNDKIIELHDNIILQNKELNEASSKILRTIQRKFDGLEINKKLESWYELTFAEFVKELSKKKNKAITFRRSRMGRLLFTRTTKSNCPKTTNNHHKPGNR